VIIVFGAIGGFTLAIWAAVHFLF
jgi:hypothetical protein